MLELSTNCISSTEQNFKYSKTNFGYDSHFNSSYSKASIYTAKFNLEQFSNAFIVNFYQRMN